MQTQCAWCQSQMSGDVGDTRVSHGLCFECLPSLGVPVQRVDDLTAEDLDALPYGAVRLDDDDRIVEYNTAEQSIARRRADDVMGKNFFTDVAPCTNVRELSGWLRLARERGEDAATHERFVFDFPFGKELVRLSLFHTASTRQAHLLVRPVVRSDVAV